MVKFLLVGGTFDEKEGKSSGYVTKLDSLLRILLPMDYVYCVNGGHISDLGRFVTSQYSVIIWMPNISNDEPKRLQEIKEKSPHTILVMSKNNRDNKYSPQELVMRMLKVKANLCLEIIGETSKVGFIANLVDPLGNSFCYSDNIAQVANALVKRVKELLSFTRIKSVQQQAEILDYALPSERFLKIINESAETFHGLIHGANPSRFLGNCSFRCEKGFPSFIEDRTVWVSKRDVDKRYLNYTGFVPVKLSSVLNYCGDKPSVDAAIHCALYNYYPRMRYALHSHVYINGADTTERRIPCGAFEEVYEIIKMFPDRSEESISVNLLGHGSLIMSSCLQDFEHIGYKSRPLWEGI